jgi:predicted transcriptional regulator
MSTNAPSCGGGIRERRRQAAVSQQQLAQLADSSLSMIRLLERGYQPSKSVIQERVLRVLDTLNPEKNGGPAANGAPVKVSDGPAHGSV